MSILDYQNKELSPEIWTPDKKLKNGIRRFILSSISAFFEENDFSGDDSFLIDALIGSSLATYFYKDDSDLDIKLVIDVNVFRQYNTEYADSTDDDILDELIEMGRTSPWLTAIIPGTMHPMDAYYVDRDDLTEDVLVKYDSLYSVVYNEWLKEPKRLEGSLSPSYVLNYAKGIAQQYINKISNDIDKVKRDSIDFIMLRDYMKTLDKDDIQNLYTDFETSLENVNKSVEMAVEDKTMLRDLRKRVFSKKELNNN